MKSYFAYIRVSTVKQGEHGSSLQEQRDAITAFSQRSGFTIATWFEEMETAAKQGRTAFNRMIAELEGDRARGVIIHKIDRSARNLRDWARLGELMDRGIEVHFVTDNLDLTTRGGRLSADIQAVVAADYIRNLREEVRKGFYGRLKQGLYPLPAPRGYLNRGKGKPKVIDPDLGPLVRQAFELYGTGNLGLHELRVEMSKCGLRGRSAKPLSLAAISTLLHNPFYVGLIHIARTGETFEGVHTPLVPKSLFDRVQAILAGRTYARVQIHHYQFRRLIKCHACSRSLIGERQKGHVYYRCHSLSCPGVSIAEGQIDEFVRHELGALSLSNGDVGDFREVIQECIEEDRTREIDRSQSIERDLGSLEDRLTRLTDALIDGLIDKTSFDERKAALIARRIELRELQSGGKLTPWESVAERFELGFAALQGYEIGNADEKRDTLKSVCSNLVAHGKKLEFPMFSPFEELRIWSNSRDGAPRRGAARTSRRTSARRKRIFDFVTSLAEKVGEIQTDEDAARTQAPAWRPDYRSLLSGFKPRRPRARQRKAARPRPGFDTDRQAA